MKDERISRLLADLPRHEASPYFTAKVLRRLAEEPRRRGAAIRRWALAAGTAAALGAGLFAVHVYVDERERREQREEALAHLEALETRKTELEKEIRSLRHLARDAQPVVYLGSTPSVDVVVDLGRLARRAGLERSPRPASRTDAQPRPIRFVSSPPQGENHR